MTTQEIKLLVSLLMRAPLSPFEQEWVQIRVDRLLAEAQAKESKEPSPPKAER